MIPIRKAPLKLDRFRDPYKYFNVVFISFLQEIFKNQDEGNFKFSEDVTKTEIIIADQMNLLREEIPRIIAARGEDYLMPLSLDDFVERQDQTGARKRSLLVQSSITFNCLARVGLEAKELAWLVTFYLNAYNTTLNKFGIHKILRNNIRISPETPANAVINPETKYECTLVCVTVPFIYRNTFIMTPSDFPVARDLKMSIGYAVGEDENKILENAKADPVGIEKQQTNALQEGNINIKYPLK